MKAVMFAGGVGSRLWPLSRKKKPKQFMHIVDDATMLQIVVRKLKPDIDNKDIFIITGRDYGDQAKEQLSDINSENFILEPVMRDVGPAVGLIAAVFSKLYPTEALAILWGSDHLVKKEEKFRKILKTAEAIIKKEPNKIVFVGQKPRFASENLGWIHFGNQIEELDGIKVYGFKGFKYRPNNRTAQKYFTDGHYAWNLGYFVTTPTFLWNSFKRFEPELFNKLAIIQEAVGTPDFNRVLDEIYPTIETIHFDNAILEKLQPDNAYIISEDIGWSDIGAWEALKEALEESKKANVTNGRVLLQDCTDSLAYNYDNEKLVVGIDLDDFLIVNTEDVLLVTKKASVPKIKTFVKSLDDNGLSDLA